MMLLTMVLRKEYGRWLENPWNCIFVRNTLAWMKCEYETIFFMPIILIAINIVLLEKNYYKYSRVSFLGTVNFVDGIIFQSNFRNFFLRWGYRSIRRLVHDYYACSRSLVLPKIRNFEHMSIKEILESTNIVKIEIDEWLRILHKWNA